MFMPKPAPWTVRGHSTDDEELHPAILRWFITHFNTVVHKEIITKRDISKATPKHRGQHITRFRLGVG
jgi:hypothetical protein